MNSDQSILEDISGNGLTCESELARTGTHEVDSLSEITPSKSPSGSLADASYIGEVEEGSNTHSLSLNASGFCSSFNHDENGGPNTSSLGTSLVNNESVEYPTIFTTFHPLQHTIESPCPTYTTLEEGLQHRDLTYAESPLATITLPSSQGDTQALITSELTSKKLSKQLEAAGSTFIDTDFQHINCDYDSNSPNMSHATRVSPATIEWLIHNYETSEGVSIPRSELYQHYQNHCQESGQEPVNAASFGKLIRSVFLGLRTRRIGTRGNSKYHYYGIRVKRDSRLNGKFKGSDVQLIAPPMKKRCQNSIISTSLKGNHRAFQSLVSSDPTMYSSGNHSFMQYFNIADSLTSLEHFPSLNLPKKQHPPGLCDSDISNFKSIYLKYCLKILKLVQNCDFNEIEKVLLDFWPSSSTGSKYLSEYLSEFKIIKPHFPSLMDELLVQQFIREADLTCYQKMVDILVPNVLSAIPSSLTQLLRHLGKNMETWMKNALSETHPEVVKIKMACIKFLNLCLKRYTGLNHLAQASRAVLGNSCLIQQMVDDLNKIDFDSVRDNCGWICDCNSSIVTLLEEEFKNTLKREVDLETWAKWLEDVVDHSLEAQKDKDKYFKASRQFLLRWSFYSSMILRDLTLRSATSFGSFHLIRLLYEEYLHYAVEKRVAYRLKTVPMALVMVIKEEDMTICDDVFLDSSKISDSE